MPEPNSHDEYTALAIKVAHLEEFKELHKQESARAIDKLDALDKKVDRLLLRLALAAGGAAAGGSMVNDAIGNFLGF